MKNVVVGILILGSSVVAFESQAAYLTESYQDNSAFSTAQFIDSRYFDSKFDRDINSEFGTNVSTSSLHASVMATGDNTADYYSFNLQTGQAFFDIDYAASFGGVFDSWIELYDSSFNLLAFDDDSSPRESGSFSGLDSFISYNLSNDGLYYVAVGSYPNNSKIPFGANYTLQISQGVTGFTPSPVPVPAAIWLFASGILSLFGFAAQRKRK